MTTQIIQVSGRQLSTKRDVCSFLQTTATAGVNEYDVQCWCRAVPARRLLLSNETTQMMATKGKAKERFQTDCRATTRLKLGRNKLKQGRNKLKQGRNKLKLGHSLLESTTRSCIVMIPSCRPTMRSSNRKTSHRLHRLKRCSKKHTVEEYNRAAAG